MTMCGGDEDGDVDPTLNDDYVATYVAPTEEELAERAEKMAKIEADRATVEEKKKGNTAQHSELAVVSSELCSYELITNVVCLSQVWKLNVPIW